MKQAILCILISVFSFIAGMWFKSAMVYGELASTYGKPYGDLFYAMALAMHQHKYETIIEVLDRRHSEILFEVNPLFRNEHINRIRNDSDMLLNF